MSINKEIGRLHGKPPMDQSEVAAIARSVHRKRREWIAKGSYYTPEQKTLWGRERGIRSGAARRKRNADRDRAIVGSGETNAVMAAQYGISVRQVRRILSRGT